MLPVKVQFVSEDAKSLYNGKLEYATEGSSGFDLRAYDLEYCVPPQFGLTSPDEEGWSSFTPDPNSKAEICIKTIERDYGYEVTRQYCRIPPQGRLLIKTGIRVSLHSDYEIQIRPRSGMAVKHGITVLNTPGTIDSDYRGELGVILINHGDKPVEISLGDRIAQAVVCPVIKGAFEYVENLDETDRAHSGFGSTGNK